MGTATIFNPISPNTQDALRIHRPTIARPLTDILMGNYLKLLLFSIKLNNQKPPFGGLDGRYNSIPASMRGTILRLSASQFCQCLRLKAKQGAELCLAQPMAQYENLVFRQVSECGSN